MKSISPGSVWVLLLLAAKGGHASHKDLSCLHPNGYKKWRKNPKMVVFGDSTSDSGRRLNAPESFDFEGIGAFPWRKLYATNDAEEKFRAYLPSPGAVTNGKVWADWLRIPEDLNFATSSASMTDPYRSRDSCTGYTGEGEEFPTGTFTEQIDRYFNDIISNTNGTLDYTHVIVLGGNDITNFFRGINRYEIGQELQTQGVLENTYEDPVPYNELFKVVNGVLQPNVELLINEVVTALSSGVERLLASGVTGRILIANIPAFKILPDLIFIHVADTLDKVAIDMGAAIEKFVNTDPQLRLLDVYTLFAAVVDNTGIFEKLGFSAPENLPEGYPVPFANPCLKIQFFVDRTSEVMNIQTLRSAECQNECALCADDISPCQNCYAGNPSATICDNPYSRIFWDSGHATTGFHLIIGEAVRQCSKDQPNYDCPFVQILCPSVQ